MDRRSLCRKGGIIVAVYMRQVVFAPPPLSLFSSPASAPYLADVAPSTALAYLNNAAFAEAPTHRRGIYHNIWNRRKTGRTNAVLLKYCAEALRAHFARINDKCNTLNNSGRRQPTPAAVRRRFTKSPVTIPNHACRFLRVSMRLR